MEVLVVCNQKGGVGKTTLAGHLGVEAVRQGVKSVAFMDLDPQGNLSDWWNVREADEPAMLPPVAMAEMPAYLQKAREAGIDLLIIDCPPAKEFDLSTLAKMASLVLVPVMASPHDLRAVTQTIEVLENVRAPMSFMVNGVTPRARLTGDAARVLSQFGKVSPDVQHRQCFRTSMIDGRTCSEIGAEGVKGAMEIALLYAFVARQLTWKQEKKFAVGIDDTIHGAMA